MSDGRVDYEQHGRTYALHRRADPRIAANFVELDGRVGVKGSKLYDLLASNPALPVRSQLFCLAGCPVA